MIISEQIASYLDEQGIGTFSKADNSGNIFIDYLPSGGEVVSIYNKAGNGGDTRSKYRRIGIQVIYRGNKNPIASFEKAQEVFVSLNGFEGTFAASGNYVVSCLSLQGQAECIGKSQAGDYEYTMNFIVEYKE